MNLSQTTDADRERRLDEALGEYFDAAALGHRLDRKDFLDRHQDLAADLAQFFANEERMEGLTTPLRPVGSPAPSLSGVGGAALALTAGQRIFGDYELLD